MRVLLLSFLVALCGVALAQIDVQEKKPEVIAPIGKIRGSFMASRLGKRFFAARGLRYAEPPVGELRFQPPVPVKPWKTVFDATQEGPACPQPRATLPSEDCLRLNVYTQEIPDSQKSVLKKSVLVFFHPGGFYLGSGQSLNFGPEYLMDHDIVLVTVNYRLQSLGFISTGDSYAPGNLGLKDQVIALRWIQKNIEVFGGDPKNVTISGHSAGGWSVSLHMVSPMSHGLFHRAIVMSGAATSQLQLTGNQTHLAKKQAGLLGCPTNTTADMIACLKTKPAQEFSDSFHHMFEWNYNPILLWSPVIEPEIPGLERFLTADPEDLIRQGKFHQVPLMTGITKDEFGGNVVFWVEAVNQGNNSLFDDLNNKWEDLAPILFAYERGTPRSKHISKALKSFYFKDKPISVDTVNGVAQLYADGLIGFSVHRLAKLVAEVSTEPVYYYEFTYQGRYSHSYWNDSNEPYGVVHHDDLLYLFYPKKWFPYFEVEDPEYKIVKRMTSMWTSFAKTGNPIPIHDEEFKHVKWDTFTSKHNRYLKIGKTMTMNHGLYAKRRKEWEKLFPLYPAEAETNVKN